MPGSRLRRAASFAPVNLVAPVGTDVTELAPDVMRFLFEPPARIADSGDLASAARVGPFPAIASCQTHGQGPMARQGRTFVGGPVPAWRQDWTHEDVDIERHRGTPASARGVAARASRPGAVAPRGDRREPSAGSTA